MYRFRYTNWLPITSPHKNREVSQMQPVKISCKSMQTQHLQLCQDITNTDKWHVMTTIWVDKITHCSFTNFTSHGQHDNYLKASQPQNMTNYDYNLCRQD